MHACLCLISLRTSLNGCACAAGLPAQLDKLGKAAPHQTFPGNSAAACHFCFLQHRQCGGEAVLQPVLLPLARLVGVACLYACSKAHEKVGVLGRGQPSATEVANGAMLNGSRDWRAMPCCRVQVQS